MAAFTPNEGYANARTRRAALFDPLLGAHPFDKSRLLTDRSAYVSFLEVQLERVTAACLATQGFSDRIDQLQQQISALEPRLARATPSSGAAPVCSCQATCVRLADDALAAVQAVDEKVERSERNFQNKLSEVSSRVIDLLKQVVTKQRDMQLRISGNIDISDRIAETAAAVEQPGEIARPTTPSATLRVSGEVAGNRKSQPAPKTPPAGSRLRSTSAPGAAAAQARRRKAVDELLKELDLLEGN